MEIDIKDVAEALGMKDLENIRLNKRIAQLERELVAQRTGEPTLAGVGDNGVSETANVA